MKDKSFAKESTQNKSKSIVVGLDIGTTKIACFVGVKNEHGKSKSFRWVKVNL